MFKYLVAFLLIMHGVAHVTGPLGFWQSGAQAFADEPWLFSQGVTARGAVGRAFGFLWLAAALGLIGTGLGIPFEQPRWLVLGAVAAAMSLVAILPWVRTVPPGAWAGALLDLVIIGVVLSPLATRVAEALR